MAGDRIIVWFRRDLRIADHPALAEALRSGSEIICAFIWAPEEENPWAPGAASRWWLHHSLTQFSEQVRALGSCLVVRKGRSFDELKNISEATGAKSIFYTRLYEPKILARDLELTEKFNSLGIQVRSFSGHLLSEPSDLKNQQNKAFQVFTPYWRAYLAKGFSLETEPLPKKIRSPKQLPKSDPIESLRLLPKISWDQQMKILWSPGEKSACEQVDHFLKSSIENYNTARDIPSTDGTSRLSPHLHFGEISVREVFKASEILRKKMKSKKSRMAIEIFQKELGWREFAHHLLYHFPITTNAPLRPVFEKFPWQKNPRHLKAWAHGKTGYPIVDAGMRELWATGWMHNRVRMITASFLTKDLRISWLEGAKWFWDTLVDADLASNTLGWQWAGGCGADAAPYFRIFNPTAQQEKFDPKLEYILKWVPELKSKDYPAPIVDHKIARDQALKAFASLKSS